jgi:hypothetical protein
MTTEQNTNDALETATQHSKNYLTLDIQHFASGGDSGADGAGNEGDNAADGNNATGDAAKNNNSDDAAKPNDDDKAKSDSEKLDKIIQARVDRAMADERKKSAELQKKLEKMKKEKMSDEELKQLEIEEREQAIAEKEKAITEKENRLFAIKAIKEAGLDDGSDKVLDLVDFVISGTDDTEETIQTKVKSFSDLVKKMVASEVDKTFKANGRIPNGAQVSGDKKDTSNIAVKLGKERAEQNKKANDVLSYYTGGKK